MVEQVSPSFSYDFSSHHLIYRRVFDDIDGEEDTEDDEEPGPTMETLLREQRAARAR